MKNEDAEGMCMGCRRLCRTLGPFNTELCLSEGEKSRVKYGEAAGGGPREGQMEKRQIDKLRG